jgi:microcystin-dependent protein
MHFGNGYTLGENSGEQSHTLLTTEVPAHTHLWNVTTAAANAPGPSGNLLGGVQAYNKTASNQVAMNTGLLSSFGGNQPHENRQPFLTLNFCIAISGIFPSRS